MKNKKIKDLEEKINYFSDKYYNGEGEISDKEFDDMWSELEKLDPNNPTLKKVGSDPSYGKKVKHPEVMGSLNKVNSIEDFMKWYSNYEDYPIILTPKIDGCAVRLIYEKGKFVQGVSRGNGEIGQDVTDNIKNTKIPKKLLLKESVEVRGEIYIKKSDFNKHATDKANPRNAASGNLNQKDPNKTLQIPMYFFCYGIQNKSMEESDRLYYAEEKLGFNVVGMETFPPNTKRETFEKSIEKWENEIRQKLDYEIDGLVFSIDNNEIQNEVGMSSNRPRAKMAYKFKPETKLAKIIGIEWNAGRTGRFTPVGKIEPIQLCGTKVSNVNLHNISNVKELGIGVGSEVIVEKAGEIIPQVVKVIKKSKRVKFPETCPYCSSTLEMDENDVNLWCYNKSCPSKQEENILHYVKSLELKGLGEGIIKGLFEKNLLSSIPDLYDLTKDQIMEVTGGKRSAEKVFDSINNKKEVELDKFLSSLGISYLGKSSSKEISKEYDSIDKILKLKPEELVEVGWFGPKTSESIVKDLKDMTPTIKKLLNKIKIKTLQKSNGILSGKSFCLTGKMSRPRKDIEKDIENLGGEIKSVGIGLDYLVTSDPNSGSSKLKKAEKLGTKCISEEELNEMIR
jgi:DNA ligase (NAD+)